MTNIGQLAVLILTLMLAFSVFKDLDADTKNTMMPLIVFLVIAAPVSVILTVGVDKLITVVSQLTLPVFLHKALTLPLIVELLKAFKALFLIASTVVISVVIKKQFVQTPQ